MHAYVDNVQKGQINEFFIDKEGDWGKPKWLFSISDLENSAKV
jgi:hypothetical protein